MSDENTNKTQPPPYGTSTVKRLSKRQCAELEAALYEILEREHPDTVRGVYYQAVGLLVDKDEQGKKNYLKIQRRLLAMRRAGTIPYGWITDGTRPIYGHSRYRDAGQFARQVAGQYRKDYWLDSPVRVEVWVEKDAISGKLRPVVVEECGLDLYVARGFSSETYLQAAGEQIVADGRPTYVYIITDHDASGMSISETVERDLPKHAHPVEVTVERLAATPEQIRRYGLITQPVNRKDSRAPKFIEKYGTETVELDAIPANALRDLVRDAIERHMDPWTLKQMRMIEDEERRGLANLIGGGGELR